MAGDELPCLRPPSPLQADGDILLHRHVGKEGVLLEEISDPPGAGIWCGLVRGRSRGWCGSRNGV